MIQGEISRVLVLNLFGKSKRCFGTARDMVVLDRALSLIEGNLRLEDASRKENGL
jgi:hypothetical protein